MTTPAVFGWVAVNMRQVRQKSTRSDSRQFHHPVESASEIPALVNVMGSLVVVLVLLGSQVVKAKPRDGVEFVLSGEAVFHSAGSSGRCCPFPFRPFFELLVPFCGNSAEASVEPPAKIPKGSGGSGLKPQSCRDCRESRRLLRGGCNPG